MSCPDKSVMKCGLEIALECSLHAGAAAIALVKAIRRPRANRFPLLNVRT
jgi:hypothetical protein